MRPFTALFLIAALTIIATACRSKPYRLTLTNGVIIDTKGKPELDPQEAVYRYKMITGGKGTVPVLGVREIAPRPGQ